MVRTSVTALLAASLLAVAGAAASACERHETQVLAEATTPPTEEQTAMAAATPIDPMLLAKTEPLETETTTVEK